MSSVCCLASRRKKDFSSVAIKTYADTDRIIDSILIKMSRKIEVKNLFVAQLFSENGKIHSTFILLKGVRGFIQSILISKIFLHYSLVLHTFEPFAFPKI